MSKVKKKVDPVVIVLDIVIVAMVFVIIYFGSSLMFYIDFANRSGTLMQETEMMSFELSNNDYASLIQGKYINEFNGNTESELYHALAEYVEAASYYKVYVAKEDEKRASEQKAIMDANREKMKDLNIFANRIDKMFGINDSAIAINFTPGEAENVGDAELIEDYPSNEFEDRVGKISFASYDEIIGLLDKGEGYAYAKVKGYEGDALLITSYVFDDQLGHMATTECSIYTKKPNGIVDYDSVLMAGGTATPITIDADGVLYEANHMSVFKQCYGENSTGNTVFMVLASVSTDELDDNGEPTSVYGINRKTNSLVDEDNDVDIASDAVAFYHQMFDDYEKSDVVNFTVVE